MPSGRSQPGGAAFNNAEPDASLPPPPPYIPVDRNNNFESRSQAQNIAQQQASSQQYAPPPGPPPGTYPAAGSGSSAARPLTQSPRNSLYGAPAAAPPLAQTNPFADPNPNPSHQLQNAYPPIQPGQSGPDGGHSGGPASGMPSGPASAGYGVSASNAGSVPGPGQGPRRQGSVADHARQMSAGMANLNLSAGADTSVRRAGTVREDPLDFLKTFDTIFIVDDSASMQVNEMPDGSMGKSRWEEARDAVSGVVDLAAKYDRDGVDVYFLNNERSLENCTDPQEVLRVFDSIEPEGTTPTGTRLEILLLDYMDRIEEFKDKSAKGQNAGLEPKKRNYIIITDGSPTDDPESVIVACARRLDQRNFPLSQIGIQFIQVGNDREATEALEELDDALSKEHGIRDMVDTLTYSSMVLDADLIIKALLGGINRRLDRKKDRRA